VARIVPHSSTASVLAASLLLIAGAYQFTPGKCACLAHCRPPYALPNPHHPEQLRGFTAWKQGLWYGRACVGSCWALMLLMVIVGHGVGWMLLLGAIMAAERSGRGKVLTPLLGLLLILGAIAIVWGYPPLAPM
jgi:predicted metal-binding membrane protein